MNMKEKEIGELFKDAKQRGTTLILTELNSVQVVFELKGAGLLSEIGQSNITDNFKEAIERSNTILRM